MRALRLSIIAILRRNSFRIHMMRDPVPPAGASRTILSLLRVFQEINDGFQYALPQVNRGCKPPQVPFGKRQLIRLGERGGLFRKPTAPILMSLKKSRRRTDITGTSSAMQQSKGQFLAICARISQM